MKSVKAFIKYSICKGYRKYRPLPTWPGTVIDLGEGATWRQHSLSALSVPSSQGESRAQGSPCLTSRAVHSCGEGTQQVHVGTGLTSQGTRRF